MKEKNVKIFDYLTKIYAKLKRKDLGLRNILKTTFVKSNSKPIKYNSNRLAKNNIDYVLEMLSNENKDYELVSEIQHSLLQIEIARNVFNNVAESNLIEAAIYSEEAAMRRVNYLLSIAKKKCISVSSEYIAYRFLEFTE